MLLIVIPAIDTSPFFFFFFFNDTATTEIYTLSLHDALPILSGSPVARRNARAPAAPKLRGIATSSSRSEEHTSELQSQSNLVCRLLLEKKKKKKKKHPTPIRIIRPPTLAKHVAILKPVSRQV